MATDDPFQKRDSLSQSKSSNNKKNDKYHIPVVAFEDYKLQQQKNNVHTSRDDMSLIYQQSQNSARRYGSTKRHSIRPVPIRGRASIARSSTMSMNHPIPLDSHLIDDGTPLTPMQQILIARHSFKPYHKSRSKSPMTPSHNRHNTPSISNQKSPHHDHIVTFSEAQSALPQVSKHADGTPYSLSPQLMPSKPPLLEDNSAKSIPLLSQIEKELTNNPMRILNKSKKLPFQSRSQPPSPVNDDPHFMKPHLQDRAFSADDEEEYTENEMRRRSSKYAQRKRASSHRYSTSRKSGKNVGYFPPKFEDESNNIRKPPNAKNKKKKGVTFKPGPPPRKTAVKHPPKSFIKHAFLQHRGRSQSDAYAHQRDILIARQTLGLNIHSNSNTMDDILPINDKEKVKRARTMTDGTTKALQLLTGATNVPNTSIPTDVTYQIPKLYSKQENDDYLSSAASSLDKNISASTIQIIDKQNDSSNIISKSKTHQISSSVLSTNTEIKKNIKKIHQDIDNDENGSILHTKAMTTTFLSSAPTKREKQEQERKEKEEKKRQELEAKRADARKMKIMLERDLDNFQYDQWKKHCIAQTFSLPTLESAFKKYYQHNHVVLIKLYIVGYFCANISVYAAYDIININTEKNRLITLFIRAITAIFLSLFGYLFWSKRLVDKQNDAMVIFNLFVSIGALTVSGLGGEPGHGVFIIIMFCIHLFSGLGHLIASAICWFITFGFAIMSAIVTTLKTDEFKSVDGVTISPPWYTWFNTMSYLFLTALALSLMGMFIEFSARRQFYQRKKLQHEKKKSWRALSTLLPPDVAKSLQQGRRVAVAFRYEANHPQFRGVSVGFIQICDFHELVSKLASKNLVSMLNTIFTKWDEFASLHKVFKVETINEIYMVAGGLPYPKIQETDYSHPIRMVFFANDLMNYCEQVLKVLVPQNIYHSPPQELYNSGRGMQFNYGQRYMNNSLLPVTFKTAFKEKQNTINLKIRIGLNIGYVVAGVIGKKLPRYRLFGDTVNTASRMESTCGPGQIQMTEHFYHELPIVFHQFTQKRNNVKVKGKGEMTTYLLHKIDRDKPIQPIADVSVSQEMKDEPSSSDHNEAPIAPSAIPPLTTITESVHSAGFFGLITHTEEEEEESVIKTIGNQIQSIQETDLAKLKSEHTLPLLKSKNLNIMIQKSAETPKLNRAQTTSPQTNPLDSRIAIRIDPPDLNESHKDSFVSTSQISEYSPMSRAKRRNRKMKLAGSKKNLFADNNQNDDEKRGKKLSKKEQYKEHRRRQSFKGLWAIRKQRTSNNKIETFKKKKKMKRRKRVRTPTPRLSFESSMERNRKKGHNHQRSSTQPQSIAVDSIIIDIKPMRPSALSLALVHEQQTVDAFNMKSLKIKPLTNNENEESLTNTNTNSVSAPSVTHDKESLNNNNKVLVIDIDDDDQFKPEKADKYGSGAFVAPDTDDLFDDIDTDDSQTNGGRITPPAALTPSAQENSQTTATAFSSKQPILESVPEKTDSGL